MFELTSAILKHETMGSILFTENSLSRVSVGHSYNLKDVQTRRVMNVETASRFRFSVKEVGATPFFPCKYVYPLQINQVRISGESTYKAMAACNCISLAFS